MTRILVIEDEKLLLEEVLDLLGFGDFEAIGAPNGLEGVKLARQELPDLIICDIMMPEMDGFEVLNQLRSNPTTEGIPFIFLTARVDKNDMRRGMDLGADDYLTKPFSHNELFSAINTRLAKQASVRRFTNKAMDELRHSLLLTLPHELRTPLVGILGYGEFLATEAESFSTEDVSRMARTIVNSAQRLHHLIENYLIYAQIEIIGNDPARASTILGKGFTESPDEVITLEACRIAEHYERPNDLQLDIHGTAVNVSEEHLRKIIGELVDNAFKFSKEGTPVKVGALVGRDTLLISIGDFGRGMTNEQLGQIGAYMQFERKFYEQQGSGLGLIVAKRLVELYGGKFSIESVPQHGTSIKLIFNTTNGTAVSTNQSQGVFRS
jgi:two-component system, sensor histidine kinase and response regulator